ncbi:lipase family protein [Candidatus Comchoanobacter bicostacola]|uniref:Lipase family protein n=1 Tax=Candidatus Comchoanobacter bicostacola TaxID=2919598 RepID=A0ABY5DK05_9GAMM|nr:lipase family protein [Candidatus Comchoanobacter bicostacola]UTC24132.1 lipase family protein [Candidatus Comchoanobacter bicostacola]
MIKVQQEQTLKAIRYFLERNSAPDQTATGGAPAAPKTEGTTLTDSTSSFVDVAAEHPDALAVSPDQSTFASLLYNLMPSDAKQIAESGDFTLEQIKQAQQIAIQTTALLTDQLLEVAAPFRLNISTSTPKAGSVVSDRTRKYQAFMRENNLDTVELPGVLEALEQLSDAGIKFNLFKKRDSNTICINCVGTDIKGEDHGISMVLDLDPKMPAFSLFENTLYAFAINAITEHISTYDSIQIVGHSLGSATGTLLVSAMLEHPEFDNKRINIYHYQGAPLSKLLVSRINEQLEAKVNVILNSLEWRVQGDFINTLCKDTSLYSPLVGDKITTNLVYCPSTLASRIVPTSTHAKTAITQKIDKPFVFNMKDGGFKLFHGASGVDEFHKLVDTGAEAIFGKTVHSIKNWVILPVAGQIAQIPSQYSAPAFTALGLCSNICSTAAKTANDPVGAVFKCFDPKFISGLTDDAADAYGAVKDFCHYVSISPAGASLASHNAATKIQSAYRGYKVHKKKKAAAIKIQSVVRMLNAKKVVEAKKKLAEDAKIQALNEKGLEAGQQFKRKNDAAIKIQSVVRRMLKARNTVKAMKAKNHAEVLKIKAKFKGFKTWLKYLLSQTWKLLRGFFTFKFLSGKTGIQSYKDYKKSQVIATCKKQGLIYSTDQKVSRKDPAPIISK